MAEQPAPPSAAASTQPFRPLNVKDALSYLDRVKITFNTQTDVYDQFLTIMKDFKSQGIDTPGVIDRVSTLFRGHPVLIQGFNTFLPPGYRIECTVTAPQEEGAITTITVTTPMGMTTRTQVTAPGGAPRGDDVIRSLETSTPGAAKPSTKPVSAGASAPRPGAAREPQRARTDERSNSLRIDDLPPVPVPSVLTSQPTIATPGAVSLLSSHLAPSTGVSPSSSAGEAQGVRPPMEFNHAINYVNKIKNRFVRDPETYKAFLEILQTYQKEGKAIQDVYAQVTTLFHAAPDLLDEFKQFLPDTSADQGAALGQMAGGAQTNRGGKRPAGANKKDEGSAKKAKATRLKAEEKGKGKRVTKPELKDGRKTLETQYDSPMAHDPAPYSQPVYAQQQTYLQPQYPHPSSHPGYAYEAPPMPPPPQPLLAPKPQASPADIAFFSRVKNYISETTTYHEFLKLLNLYTQDILDLTGLVSRAFLFIGQDAALWREFRDIVGWTDGKATGDAAGRVEVVDGVRIIENVPGQDGPRRGKGDAGKGWKTYGPSYRQLPQSEISLNCSGRDALCWDVLNDEWMSQPTWASDEGFIAHKKNPHEEALHRSEEERHEYDYHIEANLRTIALLEPIATRIAIMEADERATFRLKPGLGNQSKSIYQRVIKKVYGKEQGSEVIQVLHENPCVAVPIVLARLKQKDDEWKRALREWNRVWREVDAKNFWKSLDHQAITLKFNDKRNISAKSLVSEIETIKREQNLRSSTSLIPTPQTQFSFEMSDREVLSDAVKLTFSYLDRMPAVSAAEKDRVDAFLRNFLPLVFAITPNEFALDFINVIPEQGQEGGELESNDGNSDAGNSSLAADDSADSSSTMPATHRRGFGHKRTGGDLRKKALKNAGGVPVVKKIDGRRSKVSSPAPGSRGGSPAPSTNGGDSDATNGGEGGSPAPTGMDAMEIDQFSNGNELDMTPVPADGAQRMETPILQDSNTSLSNSATPEPTLVNGATAPLSNLSSSHLVADPLAYFLPNTILPDLPGLIQPFDDRVPVVELRRTWNFFANSNFYCLLRLFQILYSRLSTIKRSANALGRPPKEIGVQLDSVPSSSLFSTMTTRHSGTKIGEHHYQRGLILCERLFDGEIDQASFEESLRGIFAIEGYILFTIDKLLHGLIKISQSCMTESRSQDLFSLLNQDRAHPLRTTCAQQIFYRTQAESILGPDENLYRIEWDTKSLLMRIQLVGKDSVLVEDGERVERDWGRYLGEFIKPSPTPGVDTTHLRPFLARDLRKVSKGETGKFPPGLTVQNSLQSKICMRSYRIFFVPHTEDFLIRRINPSSSLISSVEKDAREINRQEGKKGRFEIWLQERREILGSKQQREEEELKRATPTPGGVVIPLPPPPPPPSPPPSTTLLPPSDPGTVEMPGTIQLEESRIKVLEDENGGLMEMRGGEGEEKEFKL